MGLDGWIDRGILALSGITLILVVVYLVLTQANRAAQAEINQRQQFINQSIAFGRVANALVQAIAKSAVASKDDKLKALLTQNGITINPVTGNPVTGAPSARIMPPGTGAPALPGK